MFPVNMIFLVIHPWGTAIHDELQSYHPFKDLRCSSRKGLGLGLGSRRLINGRTDVVLAPSLSEPLMRF